MSYPDHSDQRPQSPVVESELSGDQRELLQSARDIALRRLSRSQQTRAQLEKALAGKDIPDEVAAAVLDRFEEVGLVDDQAYVTAFLDSCRATPGRSRRWISHRLVSKGVDRELVQSGVAEISDEEELASAVALLRRKGQLDASNRKEVNRRYALLARRGFSPNTISTALGVAQHDQDDADESTDWDTVVSP